MAKAVLSCIYKIHFKHNSTKFYIGSAINFSDRKIRHKHHLKKGIHKNKLLQRMYNKYGDENLTFDIVEIVENNEKILEREQYYIDALCPSINILKISGSVLGYKHSEATKKHLSLINSGKKMTKEQNHKNSLAQIGNRNALGAIRSKEFRKKLSNAKKKKIIDNSTGQIVESVSSGAKILKIAVCTLSAKLNGRLTNDTMFSYLPKESILL